MIKQIHLDECDSTQDILKEQLSLLHSQEQLVVSCDLQKAGRGRGENKWTFMEGSLCFSMNVAPHPVMSFTAMELGVIVAQFFEQKGRKLKVKWPNDLWDENLQKCGGILVQGSQKTLIAGIGLNFYSTSSEFGGIYSTSFPVNKKKEALELAEFILKNRIHKSKQLKEEWLSRCGHLNQMVRITEGDEILEGVFQGLGDHGEALICIDGLVKKIYNGTLRTNF